MENYLLTRIPGGYDIRITTDGIWPPKHTIAGSFEEAMGLLKRKVKPGDWLSFGGLGSLEQVVFNNFREAVKGTKSQQSIAQAVRLVLNAGGNGYYNPRAYTPR